MRRAPHSITLVACVSLLALQVGGLHVHVNDAGYVGMPAPLHVHGRGHHGDDHGLAGQGQEDQRHASAQPPQPWTQRHEHADDGAGDPDYDGATDVPLDLTSGTSKFLFVLLGLGLILAALARQEPAPFPAQTHRRNGRRSRWRPPLRAPPSPVLSLP